jgi:hypothetical protein
VQFRCGAAAVIGEASELEWTTAVSSTSQGGKVVRQPLPAVSQKTCLSSDCSGASANEHPSGRVGVRLRGPTPLGEVEASSLARPGRKDQLQ